MSISRLRYDEGGKACNVIARGIGVEAQSTWELGKAITKSDV